MHLWLQIILVMLISPATSWGQDFEYEKDPDHIKQTWIFSDLKSAKKFATRQKKRGWKVDTSKRNQFAQGDLLFFTDSSSRETVESIGRELKEKKVPYDLYNYKGRYYLKLGEFFEPTIKNNEIKKLFNKKVYALRSEGLESKYQSVYAVDLSRPSQNNGFFSETTENLSNFRSEFKYINEFAYNPNNEGYWTKGRNYLHTLALHRYKYNEYKVSFRLLYDLTFDLEDTYSDKVKEDQQFNFIPNEIYWKYFNNNWQVQLGYINIKWGNLIDAYVADVVSPKDTRDFILARDENIDLPSLGMQFRLFLDPTYLDVVWLPVPTFNKSGRYGSPFFPIDASQYKADISDQIPGSGEDDMAYGLRLSNHGKNFGGSLFYYKSVNREPRYRRTFVSGTNEILLKEDHFSIAQIGATLDFSFRKIGIHVESVYTQNDLVPTTLANDTDGLVEKNVFHSAFQLKPNLFSNTDVTLQYVIKSYGDYTDDLMVDENEQYASIDLLKYFMNSKFAARLTGHFGTQRGDSLVRPQISYQPTATLNLRLGYDSFEGEELGTFGKYGNNDRYYFETEYKF